MTEAEKRIKTIVIEKKKKKKEEGIDETEKREKIIRKASENL